MSGSTAKDAVADALSSKLESKIYYHRDAVVEYVEIKTMVDRVIEEKKKLLDENTEFLNTIDKVVEEKEILQQDHEAIKELVEPMEEELELVKHELEEEKYERVAAKEELATAKEQLAHQNKELKALKKKLQESEAMRIQLESPRPGMVQNHTSSYDLGGYILFFLQHHQPSLLLRTMYFRVNNVARPLRILAKKTGGQSVGPQERLKRQMPDAMQHMERSGKQIGSFFLNWRKR